MRLSFVLTVVAIAILASPALARNGNGTFPPGAFGITGGSGTQADPYTRGLPPTPETVEQVTVDKTVSIPTVVQTVHKHFPPLVIGTPVYFEDTVNCTQAEIDSGKPAACQ